MCTVHRFFNIAKIFPKDADSFHDSCQSSFIIIIIIIIIIKRNLYSAFYHKSSKALNNARLK